MQIVSVPMRDISGAFIPYQRGKVSDGVLCRGGVSTYTLAPLSRSTILIASSRSAGLSKAVLTARAALRQQESKARAAMPEAG